MGDRKTIRVSSFLIIFLMIFSTTSLFFTSTIANNNENFQNEYFILSNRSNNPGSTIDFPVNNSYLNSLKAIRGNAVDNNGSGIKLVELSIFCVNDNMYWRGTTWTNKETWLAVEGTTSWRYNTSSISWTSGYQYLIRSKATDNNDNSEIPSYGIIINFDMDEPISHIQNPLDNSWLSELNVINGTALDTGGSGIDKVELSIFHPNSNKYWAGIAWSMVETWLDAEGSEDWNYDSTMINWQTDQEYIIKSKVKDNAGNLQSPTAKSKFIFDNTQPKGLSVHIENDNNYTNTRNVKLEIKIDDQINSYNLYEMSFSFNNKDWTSWEPFKKTTQLKLSSSNGKKSIHLRVKDLAGNIAEPVSDSIILDTTLPEIHSISLNTGNKYTNSILLDIKLDCYDMLSGIDEMSFSFDGLSWTNWEPYMQDISIFIPLGDGTKNIYFKVKDSAGNEGEITSKSIIFDTTPPQDLEMLIQGGEKYTDKQEVQLQLNTVDTLSGIDRMSFSLDGITWTAWEGFSLDKTFTLTSEGVNTIHFRVSDKAGNTAEISDQIIFDETPPHSLYIFINNGAKTTHSPILILEHVALDDLSGVSKLSYSQDGYTWTNWQEYSSINQMELPKVMGEKTIFFRAMDHANNIADPVSASIYLETEPEIIDSDRDGIPDELDAFPTDPAASNDTDSDGYPDLWNTNMTEKNSNSGLWLDAFPTDPAASLDTDGDEYPDSWNPGMTSEHSVLNLKLDAYPNDPKRFKEDDGNGKFNWNLFFILITIILLIFILFCSVVLRSGKMRLTEPYNKNRILEEITLEILNYEDAAQIEELDEELNIILERKYIGGEISENLYTDIKALLDEKEI
jgi:hypothetical protein